MLLPRRCVCVCTAGWTCACCCARRAGGNHKTFSGCCSNTRVLRKVYSEYFARVPPLRARGRRVPSSNYAQVYLACDASVSRKSPNTAPLRLTLDPCVTVANAINSFRAHDTEAAFGVGHDCVRVARRQIRPEC